MADNIQIVSTTTQGKQIDTATFYIDAEISNNGRFVAYLTDGDELTNDAPAGFFTSPGYWYVKDIETGNTVRVAAETLLDDDDWDDYPNIFEDNYDVTLGNDYGIVTYGSHAAKFSLTTGKILDTYTLPEDPTSAFPPTAVTAGSVKYLFGYSRSFNITEGDVNDRFFEVDMVNTETGAQSTASINLKSYASKQDGETAIGFVEVAYIKDVSTDGRYVFVEIAVMAAKSAPNSYEAGSATLDFGIYDTQTATFNRLSDNGTRVAKSFNASSELLSNSDYYGTSYEVSDNGKYAVISTRVPDLVKKDNNDFSDVFLVDIATDTMKRISVDDKGKALTQDSGGAAISADGRFVTYYSGADLYVYDTTSGERVRLNQTLDGTMEGISSRALEMTPDGKYIVFESIYDDFVKPDSNTNREDVYRILNPFVANADGTPTHLELSNLSVSESSKVKNTVATIIGLDPGGGTPHYSLASNPGNLFKISGDKLVLAKALDFETAQSHDIKITAKDDDGHKLTQTFHITVSDAVETINGTAKANTLNGGIGADKLNGLDGNDKLYGKGGIDILDGGAGNDRLDGGTENDQLTGGSGKDTFIFYTDSGFDVVKDFTAKDDKIDLTHITTITSFDTFKQSNVQVYGEDTYLYLGSSTVELEGFTNVDALTDKNVLIHM